MMPEQNLKGTMSIDKYLRKVEVTDRLNGEIVPIIYGLYGEVGSLMTVAKKGFRETKERLAQEQDKLHEFGDILWYIVALCRRTNISLAEIFRQVIANGNYTTNLLNKDVSVESLDKSHLSAREELLVTEIFVLGKSVSNLFNDCGKIIVTKELVAELVDSFFRTLTTNGFSLEEVAYANWEKTSDRFIKPCSKRLPKFDCKFDSEERLPDKFEIEFLSRNCGQSYLRWNGVKIGDPLSDNISNGDEYRYHDVFHLAYAAILHWSPVFRSLIKHKRKSNPSVDEAQDGGRAIVVEEGLTAWIFSQAKKRDYFEDYKELSFDMLKTVKQFTAGYEVDRCPLSLWEHAILEGYRVFREIREQNSGIVCGNRHSRTIDFIPVK